MSENDTPNPHCIIARFSVHFQRVRRCRQQRFRFISPLLSGDTGCSLCGDCAANRRTVLYSPSVSHYRTLSLVCGGPLPHHEHGHRTACEKHANSRNPPPTSPSQSGQTRATISLASGRRTWINGPVGSSGLRASSVSLIFLPTVSFRSTPERL